MNIQIDSRQQKFQKISYYPFLSMISAVVKNHEIDTELPRKILTLQTMSLAFIKVILQGHFDLIQKK